MQKFIRKPGIDFFPGIKVDKDTVLDYENEKVKQSLKDLVLHTTMRVIGEGYESVMNTTIQLSEGDILLFEDKGRGYIKPVDGFCTVAEAIDDLANVKDLGDKECSL